MSNLNLDHPYFLITINAAILLAHFLTWILSRSGSLAPGFHKRFWNVILLIAILSTGFSGVILAVQVNLKLDMPIAGKLLKWHVNFGISLFIVALLHFFNHLKYYFHLFKSTHESSENQGRENMSGASVPAFIVVKGSVLLPFVLGFTAMAAQIILLREFLSLFYGNELVIGMVLTIWMVLTGFGAWMGNKNNRNKLPVTILLIFGLTILSPFTIILADILKNILFPLGSMIELTQVMVCSLILLFPFCVLSGYLFTRITRLGRKGDEHVSPGRVYAFESLGSMVSGMLLNLLLVFVMKPIQSLLTGILITSVLLVWFSIRNKVRFLQWIIVAITLALIIAGFVLDPDQLTRRMLYPNQEIEYYKDSPYGSLLVTRIAEQRNFFGNSTLMFTTNDVTSNEESTHYALLQRPKLSRVLLVEGGISGSIREILKYPDIRIDYVEVNPWILQLGKGYTKELRDIRVSIYRDDPRHFIQNCKQRYDAVLLQVSEPATLSGNRYYTLEFFTLLKKCLNPGGVCSIGIMPAPNYMGRESREVHSVLYATMKQVFTHVEIIPGEKNYFLASDEPLEISIATLSAQRGIPTEYVNGYYLDDENIRQRNDGIMKNLEPVTTLNRDFKPVVFFGQIRYWLSYFGDSWIVILIISAVLMAMFLLRSNLKQTSMMITGFTSSSLELLLLYILQVLLGNLFLMIGVIILVFMGGLFIGSNSGSWLKLKPSYQILANLQLISALLALIVLVSVLTNGLASLPPGGVYSGIILLVLAISVNAGIQFRIASEIHDEIHLDSAGTLYGADLMGSAAGMLLAGTLLPPLIGISGSLIVTISLSIIISFLLSRHGKQLSLV